MKTKLLFAVMALLEVPTGLALMVFPSELVPLLLGTSPETPVGLVIARVTGAALASLGAACWLARRDEASRAARGLIGAMSFYNGAVVAILLYAGIGLGLTGIVLWPVIVLHAVVAGWCLGCLRTWL